MSCLTERSRLEVKLLYISQNHCQYVLLTCFTFFSIGPTRTRNCIKLGQKDACISPDEIFCIDIHHFKDYKMVSKKIANIRKCDLKIKNFKICIFVCRKPARVENSLCFALSLTVFWDNGKFTFSRSSDHMAGIFNRRANLIAPVEASLISMLTTSPRKAVL